MKQYVIYLLLCLVMACSPEKRESASADAPESGNLDPESFKGKIESTPDAVVVDVRTPEETAQGIIEGAVQIDFKGADFEQQIAKLDKSKTYFVYCASGGRSGKTATLLREKGFEKVYALDGGLSAWLEKGLAIKKQ